MKTLLLNGCSFGDCWTPTSEFVKSLNCDTVANISKVGISFQRTCRSTVEWIAQNGNPHFVIVPITFSHRWELAVGDVEDQLDGSWFPIQRKELLHTTGHRLNTDVDKSKLENLIDLYYGSIPTVKTYWDKLFYELIMFTAFLDNAGIDYLMFDMCNEFDKRHIKGYKGFDKLKLIESNKKVIDIFTFCGNKFMWDSMKDEDKKDNPDWNIHHAPKQYVELEKYLLKHIDSR